jgi:hypothetical protein
MAKRSTPSNQDPAIAAIFRQMSARDQAMWAQVLERDSQHQERMMEIFSRMLDNSSVDRVLAKGFNKVSEQLHTQLGPLRDLTPSRAPLDEGQRATLASIRLALARQDFSFSLDELPSGIVSIGNGKDDRSFAS